LENAGPVRWAAGDSADVPERGRLVVDAGDKSVGIFRIDGELHAYENKCAHMAGPICQGLLVPRVVELLDDKRAIVGSRFHEFDLNIACPWHGAEYDIRTGRHAGDRRTALKRVKVFESDGRIFIEL
jgi:nitrite reductase/ring-hydroxylating ferredoxin subunit